MRLAITRPRDDAERQAKQIKALGHEPLICPLLEIEDRLVAPFHLENVQALIVTSRNALRSLSRNRAFEESKTLPVYCVGEATAEFAGELGFSRIIPGEGTAKALLSRIAQTANPQGGVLLYLTGGHLAFDLESPLATAGFHVTRIILYEAREIDEQGASDFAEKIREGIDGVILMSPRTAEIFIKIIRRFALEQEVRAISCYCYSKAIAKPLREIDGLTGAVSSHPTEAELMRLIGPPPPQSNPRRDPWRALSKR